MGRTMVAHNAHTNFHCQPVHASTNLTYPHAFPHMVSMRYEKILTEMLQKTGGNQSKLGRRLKVSQPTISRWISGKQRPDTLQHHTILKAAKDLGVFHNGDNSTLLEIPIIGYVGAGGETRLYAEGQGPFGEAPMPAV